VNAGFSGGEKKRNEISSLAVLEPKLAILDETRLRARHRRAPDRRRGVNQLRSPERSFVVVTHYQRLLNYIVPDVVHVLVNAGCQVGGKELALELEARGYDGLRRSGGRVTDVYVRQFETLAGTAVARGRLGSPECAARNRPVHQCGLSHLSRRGMAFHPAASIVGRSSPGRRPP